MGFGYQYWTTNGQEQVYNYYHSDKPWSTFIPSPYTGDVLLGIRFSGTCLALEACHQSVSVKL